MPHSSRGTKIPVLQFAVRQKRQQWGKYFANGFVVLEKL